VPGAERTAENRPATNRSEWQRSRWRVSNDLPDQNLAKKAARGDVGAFGWSKAIQGSYTDWLCGYWELKMPRTPVRRCGLEFGAT
jgi:hypothetical protein